MRISYELDNLKRIVLSVLVLVSCYSVAVAEDLWKVTMVLSGMLLLADMILAQEMPSKIAWALLLVFAVNLFSTIIHGNLDIGLLKLYAMAIVYILWCDYYCRCYTRVFVTTHLITVGLILVIQVFFQFTNPALFGETLAGNMVNFLASDNMMCYYVLPFLMLVAVSALHRKSRMDLISWVLIAVCLAGIVLSASGTGMVGCFFFAGMLIVCLFFGNKFRFPITVFYVAYILFLVGVAVFSIQDYAADFLYEVLGKSTTFTGRTFIWARVPEYILQKPLLGYGTSGTGRAQVIWIGSDVSDTFLWNSYWSAHNYFFNILIEGGFLEFAAYIGVLVIATKALKKGTDRMIVNVISVGILSMFILYTAEGELLGPAQYLMFLLAYYNNLFVREKQDRKQEIRFREVRTGFRRRETVLRLR